MFLSMGRKLSLGFPVFMFNKFFDDSFDKL